MFVIDLKYSYSSILIGYDCQFSIAAQQNRSFNGVVVAVAINCADFFIVSSIVFVELQGREVVIDVDVEWS